MKRARRTHLVQSTRSSAPFGAHTRRLARLRARSVLEGHMMEALFSPQGLSIVVPDAAEARRQFNRIKRKDTREHKQLFTQLKCRISPDDPEHTILILRKDPSVA